MSGGAAAAENQTGAARSLLFEVFHNLSQPLTALQCSLELALFRDQTLEELRASVAGALENAECLRQRLLLLRELEDAVDPGDLSQPAELNLLLRDLREELLPVFESAGQRFELTVEGKPPAVRGNHAKLTRALFYFIDYLFRYSASGAVLQVRLRASHGQAEIGIAAGSSLPIAPGAENAASCEIEIARRSFRAAGGDLLQLGSTAEQSVWQAVLPLA